ncbi:MAG: DNA mismatch repair protein MutS [Tissierellia bacterium]|nr:DNA mismatch repair protein MutS [Tissierellia bacterium]
MTKLTPMMQQYMEIKKENEDSILFFRLGDFYEMFFDDALKASRDLEIALTARDCGGGQKAPMCGIPHHVSEAYLNKLVEKGHKVAIVDQMEDPRFAKGIVKRSVTRIVTPGTITDLEGKKTDNNFLLSIYHHNNSYGISYIDITTGEFRTTEILNASNVRDLLDFIVKVNPREILINKRLETKTFNDLIDQRNIFVSVFDVKNSDIKDNISNLNSLLAKKISKDIEKKFFAILASNMLMDYIYLFQEDRLQHIDELSYIESQNFMKIDANTIENLEIHKNLYDASRKNTLLSILDKTRTPMGSRKVNSYLEFPLIEKDKIEYRLNIVEHLKNSLEFSTSLTDSLNQIFDLERILSKISYSRANARDMLNLKFSLEKLPNIKSLLELSDLQELRVLGKSMDDLYDLFQLIDEAIVDDPPLTITEGNIIKDGFSTQLDEVKYEAINGRKELIEYEIELREQTGIKTLKISFNKNVGYFIELTKSFIAQAPDYFIRRQTLKNSERYITERLNNIADKILGSQSDTTDLEYNIFSQIREKIANDSTRIKNTTDIIANVDALLSFAKVARDNNYIRPSFNTKGLIDIKDGRHPVIEQTMDANSFIPNDTNIGQDDNRIQIITGPNMAGKSTYMRQMALIILMAQIGSFVPASKCDLSISNALYTRIGASDNLAKGDSTFMVEMKEISNIINNATEDSFVILDEVGRGTSTNDGLSIAIAIVEYLSKNIKSKTFFATHYHELTQITDELDNVKNLKVDILEEKGELIFLRKIMEGAADKSYGIEVAKLSGLPKEIISRANFILKSMDNKQIELDYKAPQQLSLGLESLEKDLLLKEVIDLNIDDMSAKESYDYLYDLIQKARDIFND